MVCQNKINISKTFLTNLIYTGLYFEDTVEMWNYLHILGTIPIMTNCDCTLDNLNCPRMFAHKRINILFNNILLALKKTLKQCSCTLHANNIRNNMLLYDKSNVLNNYGFFFKHLHNEVNFKLNKPIFKLD